MSRLIIVVSVVLLAVPHVTSAQARVERNVVYGRYSGLGLLMDVYRPTSRTVLRLLPFKAAGGIRRCVTTRRRSIAIQR